MNFKTPPIGKKVSADESAIDANISANEENTEDSEVEFLDSETVALDNKINDDQKTTTINFQNQDDIDDILKKKTKESTFDKEEKQDNRFKNLDADDVREQITEQENEASKKYTAEDFANIAAFLVTLYDTGLSTGLSAWAKDTPSAYEMPKEKKRILENQLTLILIKYQQKFSLEFMFFATLILVSYIPVAKAIKRKKDIKAYEANKKLRPEPAKEKEPERGDVEKDMGIAEEMSKNPWKKKPGKQTKKIV